jgi:hypothetical protein
MGSDFHTTDFREVSYLEFLGKYVEKVRLYLKLQKSNIYKSTYVHLLLQCLAIIRRFRKTE